MLLLSAALATDLDVTLVTPSGSTSSMTFHGIDGGSSPAFLVTSPDRPDVRVRMKVRRLPPPAADAVPQWVVDVDIDELTPAGKRRVRVRDISTPRVITLEGEEGAVSQGARIPIPGTSPVEYREEAWTMTFLVRP